MLSATSKRMHMALCSTASLLSALPIFLVTFFDIWAPVGVIWETFGVHYTAYPTLALNYHFIGNAMGFAALYAYAPSFFVHNLLGEISPFDRFAIYSTIVYVLHSALMLLAALWISSRPLSLFSKLAIILVGGCLPLWLSTTYINILTVNYFWIAVILYPIAATMWVLLAEHKLRVSRRLTLFVGCACALTFWTKFTYAITLDTFLVIPLLVATASLRRVVVDGFIAFFLTSLAIDFVYFAGHPQYTVQFFQDLRALYASGYLKQRAPGMFSELIEWPRFSSALQSTAILAAATTLVGIVRFRRSISSHTAFAALSIGVGSLLAAFIVTRTAANTFMEVTLFCSFVVSAWIAFFVERGWLPIGASIFAVYLAITTVQVFGVFGLSAWIVKLKEASQSARAISDDIASRSTHRPVIYYWSAGASRGNVWPASPLWASPYLYALLSGDQTTKQPYLRKYFPLTSVRSALDGLVETPHVAVIQEFLLQDTPFTMRVFDQFPSFRALVENPKNHCIRRTITVAWTDAILPGQPAITVCTKSE
jgi:hypothetical protein